MPQTFAYAKINLALVVLGIREDGFHELQSVMQSIALHDVVSVCRRGRGLTVKCGELSGPQNIAYKAAALFLERMGKAESVESGGFDAGSVKTGSAETERVTAEGIEIEIVKNIPLQAGLAGGSADAAAVLRLLNRLYGEPFSEGILIQLAGSIGADVAFCLKGGVKWASGRGEQLEDLPAAPALDLVLTKPFAGVNTREAYRLFDEIGRGGRLERKAWENALKQPSGRASGRQIAALLYNDLEQASVRLVPEISKLKELLLEAGCYGALMSGSGSCVFGLAEGEEQAREAAAYLRRNGRENVWVTKTVPEYGDVS